MSMLEVTPYKPTVPWQPSNCSAKLLEAHADYANNPWERNEEVLAQQIASYGHDLFKNNGQSGIYRASHALKAGTGDCRAFTEVVTGVLEALNLHSYVYWDTEDGHASGLWIGNHAVWNIDGYTGRAIRTDVTKWAPKEAPWKLEQAIRCKAASNIGAYILRHKTDIELTDSPATLGEQDDPYHGSPHLICLPYLQGLAMLGAMGDMDRYLSGDEGKWYERRFDLLAYLPRQYSQQ